MRVATRLSAHNHAGTSYNFIWEGTRRGAAVRIKLSNRCRAENPEDLQEQYPTVFKRHAQRCQRFVPVAQQRHGCMPSPALVWRLTCQAVAPCPAHEAQPRPRREGVALRRERCAGHSSPDVRR